jgi:hypothetical protein
MLRAPARLCRSGLREALAAMGIVSESLASPQIRSEGLLRKPSVASVPVEACSGDNFFTSPIWIAVPCGCLAHAG